MTRNAFVATGRTPVAPPVAPPIREPRSRVSRRRVVVQRSSVGAGRSSIGSDRPPRPGAERGAPVKPHSTHDVLLVDPDLELRTCRALYLQTRGFRVAGARAADDTLLRLRAGFRPCVVLADPRARGDGLWWLVDYLRSDSVLSTVPLVLVTHDTDQASRAERHGVLECIDPPSEPERLV